MAGNPDLNRLLSMIRPTLFYLLRCPRFDMDDHIYYSRELIPYLGFYLVGDSV
jgi:hypothetical protein